MREFTLEELSKYNGREGSSAYVAYHGIVYDVSGSYFFRNGSHWITHCAGCDLSEEIADAPHDETLLRKFPVVGSLSP
jgi:predicted heme/steroid binding protein